MGAFQNLFKMNVFLLMFSLPCGYFPIQYYVTITESIVHNNDIRLLRYCLLIIPVFIVFIRAFENVLGDIVKNIYIISISGIILIAFFVAKYSLENIILDLSGFCFHVCSRGIVNSLGAFFIFVSSDYKKTRELVETKKYANKLILFIGAILIALGFFQSDLNWRWIFVLALNGIGLMIGLNHNKIKATE